MIEIQIINIPSLFWKHNTFLAVYCTLGIYLKPKKKKKPAKQISKQNKTKKKKKRKKGKRRSSAKFEHGVSELTRPNIASTPLRMIA